MSRFKGKYLILGCLATILVCSEARAQIDARTDELAVFAGSGGQSIQVETHLADVRRWDTGPAGLTILDIALAVESRTGVFEGRPYTDRAVASRPRFSSQLARLYLVAGVGSSRLLSRRSWQALS